MGFSSTEIGALITKRISLDLELIRFKSFTETRFACFILQSKRLIKMGIMSLIPIVSRERKDIFTHSLGYGETLSASTLGSDGVRKSEFSWSKLPPNLSSKNMLKKPMWSSGPVGIKRTKSISKTSIKNVSTSPKSDLLHNLTSTRSVE